MKIPDTNRVRSFMKNNRAVSPVIGIVLMIALVVILAGVVGSGALGFLDGFGEDASADVTFEENAADEEVDALVRSVSEDTEQLEFLVNGEPADEVDGDEVLDDEGFMEEVDDVTSGTTVTIDASETDGMDLGPGDDFTVVAYTANDDSVTATYTISERWDDLAPE